MMHKAVPKGDLGGVWDLFHYSLEGPNFTYGKQILHMFAPLTHIILIIINLMVIGLFRFTNDTRPIRTRTHIIVYNFNYYRLLFAVYMCVSYIIVKGPVPLFLLSLVSYELSLGSHRPFLN
jgi:hypothetical protein